MIRSVAALPIAGLRAALLLALARRIGISRTEPARAALALRRTGAGSIRTLVLPRPPGLRLTGRSLPRS